MISTVSNSVYCSNIFSLSKALIVNKAEASPINSDHKAISNCVIDINVINTPRIEVRAYIELPYSCNSNFVNSVITFLSGL